ncbi:bromodomain-containing protein 4 [Paralichthys olivaceus]|uniref:bromodomain-containing protein 4 n=1 Tax=Paralichthys olivaceus TaxID=8255 RepID=UPI003750C929
MCTVNLLYTNPDNICFEKALQMFFSQASVKEMSGERLPLIHSSGSKTAAKVPHSSSALQRPHQANRPKRPRQQTTTSCSHPHPGPSSILLSDTTMAPWGGLILSESSFTSIPPPQPLQPPPPPPAPQPTPCTPYHGIQKTEDEEDSCSSFNSEVTSPPLLLLQGNAGVGGRGLRARRKVLSQHRVPRPPRLPPLRPVTNLSFSRSFTFSFFELPLHQSPRCRAERIRNLMLLLRQIHY